LSIGLSFDWDPEKAARNLAKHGVTFGEAANVLAGGYHSNHQRASRHAPRTEDV